MIKATGAPTRRVEALTEDAGFLLGHSELEHRRLMIQAHYMRPWTTRFLRSAGLEQGMSVLDAGAGLGDVSLVAAEIVGPRGSVVGVERDTASVDKARRRAASESVSEYVRFHVASLDDFETATRFDALVGRFVLQYQPDPAATLRRLARLVRPGGIVAFHDMDFSNSPTSWPPCELWDECYALLAKLGRARGVPPDFGPRLSRTFLDAGLPWPTVDVAGTAGGKPGSALFSWLGSAVQALMPHLQEAGIDVPPGIRYDDSPATTLERAVTECGSQVLGPVQYGVWTRTPSAPVGSGDGYGTAAVQTAGRD